MTQLTVIAKLKAKAGREEDLFAALRGLVTPTRDEEGCVTYDLHRSHDDPGLFIFYEIWESRTLWEAHMKTAHLMAFGERRGDLTESSELFTGEKI